MGSSNQEITNGFKVSYYFSYKVWANQLGLQYWPGYVCLFIVLLQGILSGGTDLTLYLLCFNVLVFLFCVTVTRFYANSLLKITENGITVTKKNIIANFNWSDITFIIPSHGASHLEIILVIYTNNAEINYVFIESLYFKTAKSTAGEIAAMVEKYLKGYEFKIQRSDFYAPIMLKRKDLLPNIVS